MAFNLSCLRFATLPWAPVPPPLAAARSRACVWPSIDAASAPPLCHWTLDSRLPTLLLGGLFNIGLCMAFNFSCLRSATLPWAPVPPPHAAARPVICHGPPYRLLMLLPGP
ncbi:unnamed protein product [Staurois parvus]|uniref:Uncharacterized protein n=1 Tax=Staurois parvus TaxID=386267 RepID=A0ABN9H243_9NEOB|nr:unnamed protein product [Staurois parvus]